MEFLQSIDYMLLLRCFIVGGLICVVGQILIDKTKLTSARILVAWCHFRWAWDLPIFN